MPPRKRSSPKRRTRARSSRRGLWYVFFAFSFWAAVLVGAWCLWVGYEVRQDFRALQWALPGRIYARPLELYVGARVGQDEVVDYLRQLGYRETPQPRQPGEFS